MTCLIELHYLPCNQFFAELSKYKTVVIERHENFIKQSYRSRCKVNTSQGIEILTLPLTSKHGRTVITDIRIDHAQKWRNNHWRTIQSAYGKAPFFEFYIDALQKVFFKKHTFLYDFNFELLTLCLSWLKLDIQLQESLAYNKELDLSVTDLRNVIKAKKHASHENPYATYPYTQVFGNTFVNNMSIIDLVFCCGPASLTQLQKPV